MPVTDDFVFHRVLDSLSLEYVQLRVFYTTIQEKWSIDDMIYVCVQQQDRLSKKRTEKAQLTTSAPSKKNNNKKRRSRFQKMNNQGKSLNSWNVQNQSFKKQATGFFVKGGTFQS